MSLMPPMPPMPPIRLPPRRPRSSDDTSSSSEPPENGSPLPKNCANRPAAWASFMPGPPPVLNTNCAPPGKPPPGKPPPGKPPPGKPPPAPAAGGGAPPLSPASPYRS
eukprot:3522678-Prymnesium_polylepis.1